MRVAGLNARTHATSIDGMTAIESHQRVSDEYLIICTIFLFVLIQKNAEIACVTMVAGTNNCAIELSLEATHDGLHMNVSMFLTGPRLTWKEMLNNEVTHAHDGMLGYIGFRICRHHCHQSHRYCLHLSGNFGKMAGSRTCSVIKQRSLSRLW
jgi:hypothetical protein